VNKKTGKVFFIALRVLFFFFAGQTIGRTVNSQSPEMQARVEEVKMSAAANKQALAQFTWTEDVIISIKGEQKKIQHYQVQLGPDGKPQKTEVDAAPPPPSGRRLKQHIVAKKKEEYEDYADQMKALAQQYVPPDKDLLQLAYAHGGVTISPAAGGPDQIQLLIRSYVKPNDSMTMVFDKARKELTSIQIVSYMDDTKDVMNLTVQFAPVPGGSSQLSNVVIDGSAKQLNIAIQYANYQRM
jgi:hypothetical protein